MTYRSRDIIQAITDILANMHVDFVDMHNQRIQQGVSTVYPYGLNSGQIPEEWSWEISSALGIDMQQNKSRDVWDFTLTMFCQNFEAEAAKTAEIAHEFLDLTRNIFRSWEQAGLGGVVNQVNFPSTDQSFMIINMGDQYGDWIAFKFVMEAMVIDPYAEITR